MYIVNFNRFLKSYWPWRRLNRYEQANNKRNNVIVKVNGKDYTLAEACEIKGIQEGKIRSRISRGMNPQEAIEKEDMSRTIYKEINGEKKSYSEWARLNGIPMSTVSNRINKLGWPIEKALTTRGDTRAHYIAIDGRVMNIAEWCKETHVDVTVAMSRISRGWNPVRAVTEPVHKPILYEYNGEKMVLSKWARRYNIGVQTLRSRLKLGWSIEKALTTPLNK